MKINEFAQPEDQESRVGKHIWSVPRLFELSKKLKVMDVPLDHLNLYCTYKKLSLRDMVMHLNAVNNADLSFPIILDEDGELMDGRHRIMKAMLIGDTSIKAVRFDTNPSPCTIEE